MKLTFKQFIKENSGIERMPKGRPSSEYWASVFARQNPDRSLWSEHEQELEAAILDGSPEKFMIRDGDRIVGAVAFAAHDKSVHIEHLGSLAPTVGTQLMRRVEQFASRKKLPVTLVPSDVAAGFYKKLGYAPTGRGNLWSK